MKAIGKIGFKYRVQTVRHGVVIDETEDANLVPVEGLNHLLNIAFKAATTHPNWYIGLFEGNYTPQDDDLAASIAADSTETTAYAGSTRLAFTAGTVAAGAVDNNAARAEFAFSASKTIYGGFVVSSPTRGGTAGTLISAVRFGSPKSVDDETTLRILAGVSFISA